MIFFLLCFSILYALLPFTYWFWLFYFESTYAFTSCLCQHTDSIVSTWFALRLTCVCVCSPAFPKCHVCLDSLILFIYRYVYTVDTLFGILQQPNDWLVAPTEMSFLF